MFAFEIFELVNKFKKKKKIIFFFVQSKNVNNN